MLLLLLLLGCVSAATAMTQRLHLYKLGFNGIIKYDYLIGLMGKYFKLHLKTRATFKVKGHDKTTHNNY